MCVCVRCCCCCCCVVAVAAVTIAAAVAVAVVAVAAAITVAVAVTGGVVALVVLPPALRLLCVCLEAPQCMKIRVGCGGWVNAILNY